MTIFEIRHRWDGELLFSLDTASLARTLETAIAGHANLRGANLRGANLQGANLQNANLLGANLQSANLQGANLQSANLQNADFQNANLQDADLLALQRTSIVPEVGAFEGWKQCRDGVIVHLRIPADAARSNATGRKCRAECVEVLAVYGAQEGISIHDAQTVYRVGERVTCDAWEPNRWIECSGGLHFYLSRIEAEAN